MSAGRAGRSGSDPETRHEPDSDSDPAAADGAPGWAVRLLRCALLAFPADFRALHGEDALAYFHDRARPARARGGGPAFAVLLARTLVNTVVEGVRERLRGRRPGRAGLPEVRFAARSLRRSPGFVAACALPIALGVAATTAVVAVIDGVLLRPLPYPAPERLVQVGRPLASGVLATVSTANILDLEGTFTALDRIGAIQGGSTVVDPGVAAEIVSLTRPTHDVYDMLGVVPAYGRLPTREETSGQNAAMVSHAFAVRRWGSPEAAVGRSLDTDWQGGTTLRIVGVLPGDFVPPEALGTVGSGDLWWPIDPTDPFVEQTRAFGFARGLARLAPGATLEAANEELRVAAERLAESHPDQNRNSDGTVKGLRGRSLHAATVGGFRVRLLLLAGAVLALLLIACANVANLFLSRGIARGRELALRGLLGAGRGRLALQLMAEALLVALPGGSLGLALAYFSVDALVHLTPDLPRAVEIRVDVRAVTAAIALTLGAGALSGLAPLGLVTRKEPGELLHGGRARRRGAERLRGLLVVGQTALAIVLVTGGGLLVHSAARLTATDLGFDAANILAVRPRTGGVDTEAMGATVVSLMRTAEGIPGVERVTGSLFTPGLGLPVVVEVQAADAPADPASLHRHSVLPGFFEVLDIPILEGRGIGEDDVVGAEPVAVVSAAFARSLWGDASPVGRRFSVRDAPPREAVARTVVGVAADIRNRGPREATEPVFYEAYLQNPWLPGIELLIEHRPGADVAGPLRDAFAAAHPELPIEPFLQSAGADGAAPLADLLAARNSEEERAYALLLTVFSLLALGIASVGIYATVSYSVTRRFAEMGVRRAVGAGARDIVALVLRQGMGQAALGVALGLAASAYAAGILSDLLFEITPRDPVTYAGVATILLAVSLAACALPAWHAVRVDPVSVLREE